MRIIVDADACPSLKEITELSNQNNIECHLFCDYTHNLNIENASVHYISQGFQMVDIAISNFINQNDILITQDYGLACLALSKKCQVLNPNGIIYTNSNIDNLLEQKYLNQKSRQMRIHTKNMKKRTKEIDKLLLKQLQKMIDFTKST